MIFALPVNNRLLAGSAGVTGCASTDAERTGKLDNKHSYKPACDVPCVDSKEQPASSKSVKPSCRLVLICFACSMMCAAVLLMRLHNELYS
jgi:hypothetical protein